MGPKIGTIKNLRWSVDCAFIWIQLWLQEFCHIMQVLVATYVARILSSTLGTVEGILLSVI